MGPDVPPIAPRAACCACGQVDMNGSFDIKVRLVTCPDCAWLFNGRVIVYSEHCGCLCPGVEPWVLEPLRLGNTLIHPSCLALKMQMVHG